MLQADIDQLTKLATTLDTLADAIGDLHVRGKDNLVTAAMPGSTVPSDCLQAGLRVEAAYAQVAKRMQDVAGKIRESSANLQTTDDQFAQGMHALDFHN
jgi:hypothetical protein